MRKLKKPCDDPQDTFLLCISRVRDNRLKNRLESIADNVCEAAEVYNHCGENGIFYTIEPRDNIAGTVTKIEMERVYTYRMAKKRTPGRPIYDKLKAAAPHAICPLCGHRTITTLDHYLPKTSFPTLVVAPLNLIPACSDCNKLKLAAAPLTAQEQTIHPYYDDITENRWLFAEIIESTPASVRFFLKFEGNWTDTMKARVQKHFDVFELESLYISQSGTELANIRSQLNNILEKSNANEVRNHLLEGFDSRHENHVNSWQTAMYEAMAISEWFCNGGFNAT